MNLGDNPTIVIGADHGGYHSLSPLSDKFLEAGAAVINCGAYVLEPEDDYPGFAFKVAEKVRELESAGKNVIGILVCKSGAGVTIAANKVKGVRAVTASTSQQVVHARQHNHANVLSLSAEWLSVEEMWHLSQDFASTPYSTEERHLRRVQQIAAYESK